MTLTVGSLFAGIGGFDLGFERSGFEVRWQAEQDGKAQSVLSARFPMARLYDDVRTIGAWNLEPVDVICGGFPCQDVSVAGKREGLGGVRTGLFWEVVRIARELEPRWMVLENVPGLLSSHGGRDFHTVLSALADVGFRRTYRILDSRYFGVAQRRRRVFIVLRARRCGDGAETVLFEPQGGNWDSEAGDEARADVAATLRGRSHGPGVNIPGRGGEDDQNLVYALRSNERNTSQGPGNYVQTVAACLNPGHEAKHSYAGDGGTMNIVATIQSGPHGYAPEPGEGIVVATSLSASLGHHGHSSPRGDGSDNLIPFSAHGGGFGDGHELPSLRANASSGWSGAAAVAGTLGANSGRNQIEQEYVPEPVGVRRLTPLECERLQGFPDGWTCLCGEGHRGSAFCTCGDSHRYRQLGNAVTVPVAAWIAKRILGAEQGLTSGAMFVAGGEK